MPGVRHCFRSGPWLGAAIAGHPFRASEYNLAYRREAFFRNKGFSRSLNLHFGDDDIFISEIAHGANTAVELGEESIVGLLAHDYSYALKRAGMRHVFTESHIRRRPRLWATLAALGTPVSLACCVSALIMNPYNGFVVALASAVLLLLIAGVTAGWRRLLRALDLRVLGALYSRSQWAIPPAGCCCGCVRASAVRSATPGIELRFYRQAQLYRHYRRCSLRAADCC